MTSKVIVCCGAGGVGKTTTSAALAILAARLGRKVLVLTIDPSKRLAQALGVAANPPAPVELGADAANAVGLNGPGSLQAWMLDPKRVADDAIRRIVKSPEAAEKLLGNRIYSHLTEMVAGMHEYTAMEALRGFVEQGRYDLVVVDTPPSRHALDFLEAPGRLNRFLDGRIFRLFMPSEEPGRLRKAAGGIVGKVLGGVLGAQFAEDLSVFFGTFAGVLGTLTRDVGGMREVLSRPGTAFVLVTSPAEAALEEAMFFYDKTRELKLPFKGFVLNRSSVHAGSKKSPGPEVLKPGASSEAIAALKKLELLAEKERARISQHQKLLAELKTRAGSGNFALALPMVVAGVDESPASALGPIVKLVEELQMASF